MKGVELHDVRFTENQSEGEKKEMSTVGIKK